MTQPAKRRLGRGLAALIGDDVSEEVVVQEARSMRTVPIELLVANPRNPRRHFDENDLADLANSVREKGLLQPIVARPNPDGQTFEIVAGERRWRAAQKAGVHTVPIFVKDLSDREAMEIALIENIQRTDLNAIEEAKGYAQLVEQYSYTQQQLADNLGKSRSHIANTLRLLNLPDSVKKHIENGELTAGHARTVIASDAPEELAKKIIELGMSVRDAEKLLKDTTKPSQPKKTEKVTSEISADLKALEKTLSDSIGLKVQISDKGKKGGSIMISYRDLDQLDMVCHLLAKNVR